MVISPQGHQQPMWDRCEELGVVAMPHLGLLAVRVGPGNGGQLERGRRDGVRRLLGLNDGGLRRRGCGR